MRKAFLTLISILLFFQVTLAKGQAEELGGSLTLSGAWAIYPTVVAWAERFQQIHPKVKIDISAGGAGKGAVDAIAGLVDIGMVSRDPDPAELQRGIKAVYILKDAVFPVISEKNFYLADLLKQGITRQQLMDIYVTGSITNWNQIIPTAKSKPIHVYTRSDSSGAAAGWAAYLGKKQEDLRGVGVYGDPGVLETAKRDPSGIGYNNFSFVFTKEGPLVPGARLIPIDSNENGKIEPDEVYANKEQAITAIEKGRYPATRRNYFYIKNNASALAQEFIHFVLSEEGTQIVNEVGASLPISIQDKEMSLDNLR